MAEIEEAHIAKVRSAGFFTKGVVYFLVGSLTLMATAGLGGEVTSTQGVIHFLLTLPLGKAIISVIALGLIAYSLWRFYEMLFLPRFSMTSDSGIKRSFQRFRFFYSGVFYGLVAYTFLRPLIKSLKGQSLTGTEKTEGMEEEAALWELLSHDGGKLVIWVIALIVGSQAIWQFKIAFSASFMKKIDNYPDFQKEYDFIKKSGRLGYASRGIVFGIISFFLIQVILRHNANEYKGTEGVLQYLFDLSYGSLLSGTVALGLIGYGIFNIMVARHADFTAIR